MKDLINLQKEVKRILSTTHLEISGNKMTTHSLSETNTLFSQILLTVLYKKCEVDESYEDLSFNVSKDIKQDVNSKVNQVVNLSIGQLVTKERCSGIENILRNFFKEPPEKVADLSPTKVKNRQKFLIDVLSALKALTSDSMFFDCFQKFKSQGGKNKKCYRLKSTYTVEEIDDLLKIAIELYNRSMRLKIEGKNEDMNYQTLNDNYVVEQKFFTYSIESISEYISEQLDPDIEIWAVDIEEILKEHFPSNFIFIDHLEVLHFHTIKNEEEFPVDLVIIKTASQNIYLFEAHYLNTDNRITFEFLEVNMDKQRFFDQLQSFIGSLDTEYLEDQTLKRLNELINTI